MAQKWHTGQTESAQVDDAPSHTLRVDSTQSNTDNRCFGPPEAADRRLFGPGGGGVGNGIPRQRVGRSAELVQALDCQAQDLRLRVWPLAERLCEGQGPVIMLLLELSTRLLKRVLGSTERGGSGQPSGR